MEAITIGKHCVVQLLEDVPCIMIRWNGLPPSDEFRQGCNTVLELMETHKVFKVLTDNSQATVFSVEDQRWFNEEWLPKAQKLGYRYSAVLVSKDDPFVSFAVKNIMSKRDPAKFQAQFFYNFNEALGWLIGV
ncbi:MAG TPA: hypothetical protein VMW01_00290 [Williamwhitmania sp.]|nr:hypothetical protein [Williamwhitmania sp.]